MINDFDALQHLYGKGQIRYPGTICLLVLKVVAGRTDIVQAGLCPHMVINGVKQVGFGALTKVVVPLLLHGVRFAEHQTGGAIAMHIGELNLAKIVPLFRQRNPDRIGKTVTAVVKENFHVVGMDIKQIRSAAAINIGQE